MQNDAAFFSWPTKAEVIRNFALPGGRPVHPGCYVAHAQEGPTRGHFWVVEADRPEEALRLAAAETFSEGEEAFSFHPDEIEIRHLSDLE